MDGVSTTSMNKHRWHIPLSLLTMGLWCAFVVQNCHNALPTLYLTHPVHFHPALANLHAGLELLDDTTSPSTPPRDSNSDTVFDLVFWFNESFDTNRRFLVTHQRPPSNAFAPLSEHVLNVAFQVCNRTYCPIKDQTMNLSSDEIRSLWQYQTYAGNALHLYENTSVVMNQNLLSPQLEAISFWSSTHQKHISLPYNLSQIKVSTCDDRLKPCPQPCPQNVVQGPAKYPYVRDHEDGLCKSTHPATLPPLRPHGGRCTCESTCHTPEAGDLESLWPWKDLAEKVAYRRMTSESIQIGCEVTRKRKNEMSSYEARFTCAAEGNATLPCPIFGDFSHHLYFIPSAKLIFCGIPKVGITEWIKFIRYVAGAKDYLSLPHYKADRRNFLMRALDRSKAEELLNDPTWTKAVFIRNPLDRLLSAYMDKIVGQSYTQTIFKIGNMTAPASERPVLSFSEFVDKLSDNSTLSQCGDPKGLKSCTDPHWKPQLMTCGLDYLLPQFDFVGNFDRIAEHTKLLLERVGLWEEYGKTFDDGRDKKSSDICEVPPIERAPNETIYGFNQRGPTGSGANHHATASKTKFDELYTPELIEKVRNAYKLDFEVWDQIASEEIPPSTVWRGRDLKVVQNHCHATAQR